MPFDENELAKLIRLSRINCSAEEKIRLQNSLESILSYIDMLKEVDTTGVQSCHQVVETQANVMREDEVGELLERTEFLSNAPSHIGGLIRVPSVLKEEGE